MMGEILGLRPFVPARDLALSRRFYEAIGFTAMHVDDDVAIMEIHGFTMILQNFYDPGLADNMMLQLFVRDAHSFWTHLDPDRLVAEFGVKPPKSPTLQPWGLIVGFLFDPSGVLWHVASPGHGA